MGELRIQNRIVAADCDTITQPEADGHCRAIGVSTALIHGTDAVASAWDNVRNSFLAEFAMSKIQMYTSANCAYCVAAKNLLKSKGLDYEEIRVDLDASRREEMLVRAQRRTVPQIFVNDRLVGGYDDLVAAERSGELARLIGSGT